MEIAPDLQIMYADIPQTTKSEVQHYSKMWVAYDVSNCYPWKKKNFTDFWEKRRIFKSSQSIWMKQKYITAKKNTIKDIYLDFELSYWK